MRRSASIDAAGFLRLIEWALAGLILAMLSNALIGPVFDPKQTGGDAVGWLRTMWLPIYGVMLVLGAYRAPQLARFWLPGLLILSLVALAAASTVWSIKPDVSERRAIALLFTTLFGVYLAASFDGRAFAELMAGTFTALAIGSWIACLLVPSLGIDHEANAGAWKGLWYEKNQMGALMVYGGLSTVVAAWLSPGRRLIWLAGFLACLGLVLMSRSKTSLVALALAVGALGALRVARMGPAFGVAAAWAFITVGGGITAFATFEPAAFYKALGKDPTLTGRTDIWAYVGHYSDQAPYLGYGYAAFWTLDSIPAQYIRKALGWPVPTAHNGWLDLLIQLGWVGVLATGAVFALAGVAALLRAQKLRDGYWSVSFFAIFVFATLSESFILQQNNLPWALCVAAMARLLGPAAREPAHVSQAAFQPPPVRCAPFDAGRRPDPWRDDAYAPFPSPEGGYGLPAPERA